MEFEDFNVDFLQSNSHMMMSDSPFFGQGFDVDDLLDGDGNLDLLTAPDGTLPSVTFLDQVDSVDKCFDMQDSESVLTSITEHHPAKSPWHESDSGVSETLSFVGSPVDPNTVLSEVSPIMKQNIMMTVYPAMNNNGKEQNAEMYFQNSAGSSSAQRDGGTQELSSSGRPLRKCSRRKVSIQVDGSDSEDSNSGDTYCTENKKPVSAQPLNYYNDASSFTVHKDIKIIKVVKPPACAQGATDEDIVKALEERSKKNAQQAKINREKKKAYIKNLEDEMDKLKKENKELKEQKGEMQQSVSNLEEEVEYLKSVLANASALSGLLKNISNVKEVKLSANITSRKRGPSDDHGYNMVESVPEKRARYVKENLKKAGVCLHVNDGEACLEFCAHCSSLAQKTQGRRGKS